MRLSCNRHGIGDEWSFLMTATPQMDVLYMSSTGHVLAILTRMSEPSQVEADATIFLDDGYHLRGFGDPATIAQFANGEFVIPVSQVGLVRADLNSSQAVSPRQYQVGLPVATPPSIQNLGGAPTLVYGTTGFTITPVSSQSLILVYGPTPTSAPAVPIQTLVNKFSAPGLVSGQKYFAIAFVPGVQVAVLAFTA
jgi:hypothetical protein